MGLRAIIADLIVDATAAGKALLTAANAAAQRTLLGLGTSAVRDDSYFAIADTHAHTVISLDGTSIVDTDGNGNVRITTATSKGIVLAPLNDTVSIIRGTAQPQTLQISNTWSATDDFELFRISANTTEYRVTTIPGAVSGSNRPLKIGHTLGDGTFTSAITVNTNGTVTFPSSISASNFSGTSSGTNTGDQDLSGYATTSHTHIASAITDFSEAVDDRVAALLVAGTNITLTYNDASNTITIAAAGGGGSGDALTSNPLSQFAATSSTQLAGVMSDEIGSGRLVFHTNTTLVSPTMDLITLTETLGSELVVDGAFAAPTQYTCAVAGVNITANTFTLSSDPGWAVNDVVQYFNGGGTAATGMVHRGFYFVASNTAGVITVKTTVGGGAVDITGTGNNAQYFIKTNWFAGTGGTTGGVDSWDLSAGRAAKQVAGTATLRPVVALAPTPGTLYKIQYTVSNWSAAGTTLVFGGVTVQAATAPTANGTRTLYVTALTNGDLSLVPVTGMRADIDDLSIRPVMSGLTSSTIPFNANETLADAIANETAYSLNYTVNKAGGNDVGLSINMTDTSSPGTSIPFQIMLNGVSVCSINSAGALSLSGGSIATFSISTTTFAAAGAATFSTTITNSYAGAASASAIRTSGALFTGGTGTTNFPQFLQQPTAATAATTWSTAGTWWGVNSATGFTGNFIDCHINGGASVFLVDSTGRVTASGGLVTSTIINTGTLTLPTSTDTLVGRATTDTLTNKNITPRVDSQTSSATPSPNFATHDQYNLTALAVDATFAAPGGTPADGMRRTMRVKDNGTARLLAYNAIYRAIGVTLPTTTVINKTLYYGLIYNAADTKWDVVAVGQEA